MRAALTMLCAAYMLGACSLLPQQSPEQGKVKPIEPQNAYLNQGGVATELDLGPGTKTLLEDYVDQQKLKIESEAKLAEANALIESLRASLRTAEEERDRERRSRSGSEAEAERCLKLLRDRESKILNLQIERARLQQELLHQRIARLQQDLETLQRPVAPPSEEPELPVAPGPQR
jgi:hypothetical protein